MKIKRFFAQDVRQAIRMVRDELGADAVILSNRNVDGGVEIVAARDFDEQVVRERFDRPSPNAPAGPPLSQASVEHDRRQPPEASAMARGNPTTADARPASGQGDSGKQPAEPVVCRPAPARPEIPAAGRAVPPARPERFGPAVGARMAGGAPVASAASTENTVAERRRPGESRRFDPGIPLRGASAASPEVSTDTPDSHDRSGPARSERRLEARTLQGMIASAEHDLTVSQARPGKEGPALAPGGTTTDPLLLEMVRELKRMRETLDGRSGPLESSRVAEARGGRLELTRRLRELGFSDRLSAEWTSRLAGTDGAVDGLLREALGIAATQVPIADADLLDEGGIVALVGPTGVGKTTSIAKLAAKFLVRHGRDSLALVTVDNYRIGAHEQLKTYGRLLDVPVRTAATAEDLDRVLQNFRSKRLVLIDTPGMGQRDSRLGEQLLMLRSDRFHIQCYLVASAVTQRRTLDDMFEAFGIFRPSACVLTKLDEAVSYGAAISALCEHHLPLAFVCDGQRVPEDLHRAKAGDLLARCGAGPLAIGSGANVTSNRPSMTHSYV